MKKLNIIVAFDSDNIIGNDNKIPWNYMNDLLYFKEITINNTIVMGYNTWLSLNRKPLKDRLNVIITHKKINSDHDNVIFTDDINFYKEQTTLNDIFIIGGKQIYDIYLPIADKLYISRIPGKHEGNVYFPYINMNSFELESSIYCNSDDILYEVLLKK